MVTERSWGVKTTAIATLGFRLVRIRGREPSVEGPRQPGPDPVALRRLAIKHASQGDWKDAAATFARARADQPLEDGELGFEHAAVLLSGDQAGYRKMCKQMQERSGQRGVRPYHVARACTLAPGSVEDAARSGEKAEGELRRHGEEFWSLTEQGALWPPSRVEWLEEDFRKKPARRPGFSRY
jgi:hypothetical protein